MVWQALRRGMQSVGDDIVRAGYAQHLKNVAEHNLMGNVAQMSAQEVAERYPQVQKEAAEFAQEFLTNSKPALEDNFVDSAAHFTGRKLSQTGKFFTNNPMGQNIMFSAPFILPSIMSQRQQQMTEEEYKQMLQAQMRGY